MAQTDADISAWVKSCAKYLIEKRDRDLFFSGRRAPSNNGAPHFHDYDGVMSELDSSEREIRTALKRITNLHSHFDLGELIPFDHASNDIHQVQVALTSAWLGILKTKEQIQARHLPPGKALYLQKAATRLATGPVVVSCGVRDVRALAKRIMIEAELPVPDEKTITNWIRELKDEEMGNRPPA